MGKLVMIRIQANALERLAEDLFQEVGVSDDIATKVATSIVAADLSGHNSHGVRQIPGYLRLIGGEEAGYNTVYEINPDADPIVTSENPSTATIDGRDAFGQIVGRKAVDLGIEKATKTGVAVVGLRDATHLGRIGEWSERAANSGMLFAAFVNGQGGGGDVAPPGSAQRRFSTNPISFGVPTFDALDFPIVLDMASAQVANGKISEREAKRESIPEEWTITESGGSVTDPTEFANGEGALLPLGGRVSGYKGFGLSMIAELFAGIMGRGVVEQQADVTQGNAAMFLIVDPTRFLTQSEIEDRITSLAAYIRATEFSSELSAGIAANGKDARLPGEAEHETAIERREFGIPLPIEDIHDLNEATVEHDVLESTPSEFEEVV